jgi:hypothetical protein
MEGRGIERRRIGDRAAAESWRKVAELQPMFLFAAKADLAMGLFCLLYHHELLIGSGGGLGRTRIMSIPKHADWPGSLLGDL